MATTSTTGDRTETISVLIVDTDPVDARFLAESLELADPAISTRRAADADEALSLIEEGAIDCVLAADDLGDVDGLAFIDDVARRDESVRAVLHTEADDPALAREAWARGAAYARKDPDMEHYDVLARHVTGRMETE